MEQLRLRELFIKLTEGKRRHPVANWFELIGAVGANDDHLFRVVQHTTEAEAFEPEVEGELYFFANDLDRMYGNNRGYISVNVTRIA